MNDYIIENSSKNIYTCLCAARGLIAQEFLNSLSLYNKKLLLCDKNTGVIQNQKVYSLEEIVKQYANVRYLILSSQYYSDICDEIVEYGGDKDQIVKQIIGYEPDEVVYEKLKNKWKKESNIFIHNKGCWDKTETLFFRITSGNPRFFKRRDESA